MQYLNRITPDGSVPRLLFEDPVHHLLAMQAVPVPHDNWKTLLLQGKVVPDHFDQFASLLATIHHASALDCEHLRSQFGDRQFFESLRLEPYYEFAASRLPEAATFLRELAAETRTIAATLVHGDYSPKNVLVHKQKLVLLDHEVTHFGDGTFDVGFAMTHFLSKAGHVAGCGEDFLRMAGRFWGRLLSTICTRSSLAAASCPAYDWLLDGPRTREVAAGISDGGTTGRAVAEVSISGVSTTVPYE